MPEGSVDGLEEVEAGGGAISWELRAGTIQRRGRLMEKRVRGIVLRYVETGFMGVGRVWSLEHR